MYMDGTKMGLWDLIRGFFLGSERGDSSWFLLIGRCTIDNSAIDGSKC